MKTVLLQLIEDAAHPAGGTFKANEGQRKRKARKTGSAPILSPDCYNIRGGSSKKGVNLRRTPAP
jgi:hypothetical protein